MFSTNLLTLICLFFCSISQAEILFGSEFTFTSDLLKQQYAEMKTHRTDEAIRLLYRWRSISLELCKNFDCEVQNVRVKGAPAFAINFKDGFWMRWSLDPLVLEVTMSKADRVEFKTRSTLINSFVFDQAKALGLYADTRVGGGHINIDLESAFENDALLFRNFIVDQANFPDLQLYILGGHLGNAPPISSLKEKSQTAFKAVIAEFDEHRPQESAAIKALMREIEFKVYNDNPFGWPAVKHYQAVRFAPTDWGGAYDKMELRYFRAQDSLKRFLQQTGLIEKRIQFLKALKAPLELRLPETVEMTKEQQLSAYRSWLIEMGESFEDHKNLLPADLQALATGPFFTCKRLILPQ